MIIQHKQCIYYNKARQEVVWQVVHCPRHTSQTHFHVITKNCIFQTGSKLVVTTNTNTCILTFCQSCSSLLSLAVYLCPCCTDVTGILRYTKTPNPYISNGI